MELRHLRYFVAVAEELNFTRAAERLRTAQPSLSQQIRDLEDEVGTPLLVRTKRRVALTAAGTAFLNEARLTLAQAQRAITLARRAAHPHDANLSVGFVPAAEVKIFPGVLTPLRAQFPALNLHLRSLTTAEQRDALLDETIDVAFMRLPADDPRLCHRVVLREHLVAVLPANHPLAAHERVSLHDLAEVPYVSIVPAHAGQLHQVIDGYVRAHGVSLRTAQDVTNVLTCLSVVGMGVGFCLLPDYAEHLVFNNLTTRPLVEESPAIDLAMVWRAKDDTPELAALRSMVGAVLPPLTD